MSDSKWLGSEIKICHKKGRIREEFDRAYRVSIEIGDVRQDVTVSKEFAKEQLEG